MTTTITRAMLSEAAARRTGLSKADTAAIGEAMFALMGEALMAGENVKLTAFGSLQVRSRAEREFGRADGRRQRAAMARQDLGRHIVRRRQEPQFGL